MNLKQLYHAPKSGDAGNKQLLVNGGVGSQALKQGVEQPAGKKGGASATAPERANLDVRFDAGVLRITLSEGEIQNIVFEIDGGAKVVAADVPVRFEEALTFFQAEQVFALPAAVIDAVGE